jgi:serine/threonine protein kinase
MTSLGMLKAGSRLDRCEMLCPLAEGGMAIVWLARIHGKRGFEKLVAVKTIKPRFSEDIAFETMFLDEARIAARIDHPNVVRIMDLGEQDDTLYIVMEYVEGDALARVRSAMTRRGVTIPPGVALRIMADVCAGLHAAHELRDDEGNNLGVVHRDISPQNILVTIGGAVKIIDFGIAKARDRASVETSAGVFKGKVRYLAPEQAMGVGFDRRADIWAVGVCLYELIAGALPYDGETDIDTLAKLSARRPPRPLPRTTPEPIKAIIKKALTWETAGRFATAAEMQRAIERTMLELQMPTTPEDVASFLDAHLGDRTTKRRQKIAEVIAGLSSPDQSAARRAVEAPMAWTPAGISRPGVTPAPQSTVQSVQSTPHGVSPAPVQAGQVNIYDDDEDGPTIAIPARALAELHRQAMEMAPPLPAPTLPAPTPPPSRPEPFARLEQAPQSIEPSSPSLGTPAGVTAPTLAAENPFRPKRGRTVLLIVGATIFAAAMVAGGVIYRAKQDEASTPAATAPPKKPEPTQPVTTTAKPTVSEEPIPIASVVASADPSTKPDPVPTVAKPAWTGGTIKKPPPPPPTKPSGTAPTPPPKKDPDDGI